MAAGYRLRQGVRALLAFARTVDEDLAARYLGPAHLALFRRMTRSEQLHSLNVLRTVLAQQPDTPADLAVAALLHDCGKSRYALSVAQKTLAVVVGRALPALARRLSVETDRLTYWRAPFVVRRQHPAWSARLLADLGTPARVIWLVEHHAEPAAGHHAHPHAPLLQRLQRADDVN
ncbi:MAG: HD domain-containing protein [Anaerolineae bacterium]|jgi:hypothetical protein|nr:HD domain-containing protein [Anaerolineae bacterium]